jgi:hypothetical protein
MSLFGAGWASGSNPAIRRLIDLLDLRFGRSEARNVHGSICGATVLVAFGAAQESGIDQHVQRLNACRLVEAPQALGLFDRQLQTGHLRELAADPVKHVDSTGQAPV